MEMPEPSSVNRKIRARFFEEEIIAMVSAGATYDAIAEKYLVSPKSIVKMVKERGLAVVREKKPEKVQPRKRLLTTDQHFEFGQRLYDVNIELMAIAEELKGVANGVHRLAVAADKAVESLRDEMAYQFSMDDRPNYSPFVYCPSGFSEDEVLMKHFNYIKGETEE